MARILVLVNDLLFQSKILETARHVGVEVKVVGTGDALVKETQAQAPALVIVDLNTPSGAIEAIERLKADGSVAPVIGFLSHVQVDLAARAQAAGCAQVMPRSKFTQQLARILTMGHQL